MTLGIAWVGTRADGRRHLYLSSDSRTRGGLVLDVCPKIIPLPRGDCAICFAGSTVATYPLMLQLQNAVQAHQPALDRSLDIATLKNHLLRVFSDIVNGIKDASFNLEPSDLQFIFAGYSWMAKDFKIWTIYYSAKQKSFRARDSVSFVPRLTKAAFIGDWAKEARSRLLRHLAITQAPPETMTEYGPFEVLRDLLRQEAPDIRSSIGGAPQLVRIGEHMNTRVLAILWPDKTGQPTLMGRTLYDYENTDNWILDPDGLVMHKPRSYGNRGDGTLEPSDGFVIK